MAEFCKQCSEELFGEDFEDFKTLCNSNQVICVLCEDCGTTLVDHEGRCVYKECMKRHGDLTIMEDK